MRVAVDARTLQERPLGGVGRALARILPLLASRTELTLLTAAAASPTDLSLPERSLRTPWPGLGAEWLQWSAPRWLSRFEGVFHCPFYGLPFRQPVPMVVTLHDLTFEHHPGWMPATQRAVFRVQARWAARTARAILTPSRHVADDIAATYGVPTDRLFVAPPAVDPVFRPGRDASPLLDRLGVHSPYLVAVGGATRRRLDIALDAWRGLRDLGLCVDLVVAGVALLPAEPGLAAARFTDEQWAALLAGAQALVYPTEYEGFGLPPLEAIASGTPVVCSPVGALPEVLGDAAVWSPEPSAEAMTEALAGLLRDQQRLEDLRVTGLLRAKAAPGWAEAADTYLRAYELAS